MPPGEIFSKIKNIKGIPILAALFVVGLVFVLMEPGKKESSDAVTQTFSRAEYVQEIEQQLRGIISGISGAGSAKVMVTIENSPEQYYQRNTKTRYSDNSGNSSSEKEESLVFEDKQPILVKEILPKIKGVAIVCEGARNQQVMHKIINLVSCALDVPTNRIYVTY